MAPSAITAYLGPFIARGELSLIEDSLLRAELSHLRAERWHAGELLQVLRHRSR